MSVTNLLNKQLQFDPELSSYHHTLAVPDISKMPLFGNQFAYIIDASKGAFIAVTESFERITGHRAEQLTIPFWYDIVHPDDSPIVKRIGESLYRIAWQVLPLGPDYELKPMTFFAYAEYRIKKTDGNYIRIGRQTSLVTKDRLGYPVHTIGVCSDLTGISNRQDVVFHINIPEKDEMENLIFSHVKILSPREWEIAKLLMKGWDSKTIAAELNLSFNTVNTHRRNILRRIGVKNTTQLVLKLTSGN